jgi:hypothetical protein
MKTLRVMNFRVLVLLLTVVGIGTAQKASAEIGVDYYLRCGEYSGLAPDVSLTRYTPFAGVPNMKPTWAFSYAVKDSIGRTEVSCLALGSTQGVDGSVIFSGDDCTVTLTKEADQTYSVTYENNPKITGCVFDSSVEQLLKDFNNDLNTTGVVAPIAH